MTREAKYKLEDLLKIAEKIEDKSLREKTINLMKDPKISNHSFKEWKPVSWDECPAGPESFHHGYPGGLVDHTYSVVNLCINAAEHAKVVYEVDIDMDVLISSALLHDIAKLFEWRWEGEVVHSGLPVDHTIMGTSELYAQGFPHEVVHCVAAHAGEFGTTEPRTLEAKILHEMDYFDAKFDGMVNPGEVAPNIMFLNLDDE